jgi:hypothetical protein
MSYVKSSGQAKNTYLAAGRAAGRDGALRRDLYTSSEERESERNIRKRRGNINHISFSAFGQHGVENYLNKHKPGHSPNSASLKDVLRSDASITFAKNNLKLFDLQMR